MDGMTKVLLKKSDPSGLTYVSDWNGRSNAAKVQPVEYNGSVVRTTSHSMRSFALSLCCSGWWWCR